MLGHGDTSNYQTLRRVRFPVSEVSGVYRSRCFDSLIPRKVSGEMQPSFEVDNDVNSSHNFRHQAL